MDFKKKEENKTKLALKGGDKICKKPFLKWPIFDQCEEKALLEVLKSRRWFSGSLGGDPRSKVAKFERKFAEYQGAKYAIAVANGAAALEVTLRSLGIAAGDEVIVPAYTFYCYSNSGIGGKCDSNNS